MWDGHARREIDVAAELQRRWEALHEQMLDLEEAMRREDDERARARLEDQWRFVMMDLSELEEAHGPFSQRDPVANDDLSRERDAA